MFENASQPPTVDRGKGGKQEKVWSWTGMSITFKESSRVTFFIFFGQSLTMSSQWKQLLWASCSIDRNAQLCRVQIVQCARKMATQVNDNDILKCLVFRFPVESLNQNNMGYNNRHVNLQPQSSALLGSKPHHPPRSSSLLFGINLDFGGQ